MFNTKSGTDRKAYQKSYPPLEGQEEIVSGKIITEDEAVAEVFNNFSSILFQT